jgi:anaerobic ribonucleoside-triphosphate reductase
LDSTFCVSLSLPRIAVDRRGNEKLSDKNIEIGKRLQKLKAEREKKLKGELFLLS